MNVSETDLHEAYRDVFSTQSGQVVMADLIRCFGFTDRLLLGPDPHTTYFNEGRRSVLIHIQRRLVRDPRDLDVREPEYDGVPQQQEDDDDVSGTD